MSSASGTAGATAPRVAARRAGRLRASWRWSLRAQLSLVSALVIAAGLVSGAALQAWRVHASLLASLDASLSQQLHDVQAQGRGGALHLLPMTGTDGATLVQLVDRGGRVVASSGNIVGEPALFHLPAAGRARVWQVDGARGVDSGPYRVAVATFTTDAARVTAYVARSTASIEASMHSLEASLAVGVPGLVVLFSAVAWLLLGRALRPVEAMRTAVARAPGDRPSWRLHADQSHRELRVLAATFNELLDRLEVSSARQRRFVADAAHELRHPVATLQARLDLHGQGEVISVAETRALAGEAARLGALIESLLALARLDAHDRLRCDLLDLDDLVLDQVRRIRDQAPELRIDATGVSAAQVVGDRTLLDRLVANLLDNAIRHARTVVAVTLHAEPREVVLTVSDDGSGVPAGVRERIFERFARLDEARDRDSGGAGLGLAIVREAATAHGGRVRVLPTARGARFEARLPRG